MPELVQNPCLLFFSFLNHSRREVFLLVEEAIGLFGNRYSFRLLFVGDWLGEVVDIVIFLGFVGSLTGRVMDNVFLQPGYFRA
jgi:hypothetical protein